MSKPRTPVHPVTAELYRRGFVRLPDLFVKRKDMRTVHQIAHQYRDEVNEVRALFNQRLREEEARLDPKASRDAAWEVAEKLRRFQ